MVAAHGLAAPDQWLRVTSPHFTVITNSNDKQARHILDQFERMRWVFQTLFPKFKVDPPEPILILAAKNEKTFQAIEPESYLARGQLTLAGLFLSTQDKDYILLNLDLDNEQHPYATIYHEYTHLQFRLDGERLPLWANEGFAEFVQNTEIREKNVHLGMASVDNILYLRQNRIVPLDVLFRVDRNSPYYHDEQKGSVFYAESWALVHMLEITDSQNHTHRFQNYLDMCRNNEDPVIAGQKAFGDLKALQNELYSYIERSLYMEFVLNSAAAPIDESTYQTQSLTQSQADAARAGILVGVGRLAEAKSLAESVLASDANSSEAREALGFLALREHDSGTAAKWLGEAVKLDSNNYLAYYYFAQLTMGHFGEADPDFIEKSLRSAIRLNPRFAPSYDMLARVLSNEHKDLDEAHRMNVKAIELDPGQLGYRMNATNILMEQGKFEDAANVMRAALKVSKSPSQQQMIQARIDEIERIVGARKGQESSGVVTLKGGGEAPQNTGQLVVLAESPDGNGATGSKGSMPQVTVARDGAAQIGQTDGVVDIPKVPTHPAAAANAAHHTLQGVIHQVQCGYPSVLELQLVGASKTVTLFNNNYYKIELAALGFNPSGSIDPCNNIEGMKAKIEYAEAADKEADGQVLSITLMK
jgi:tetratricopeptide (TPR) repeat protein